MTDYELLRMRVRLAVAKDIAKDFRLNTSLRTIIANYESRITRIERIGASKMMGCRPVRKDTPQLLIIRIWIAKQKDIGISSSMVITAPKRPT